MGSRGNGMDRSVGQWEDLEGWEGFQEEHPQTLAYCKQIVASKPTRNLSNMLNFYPQTLGTI